MKVEDKKALIPEGIPRLSKERLEYGSALVQFQDVVRDLKLKAQKKS